MRPIDELAIDIVCIERVRMRLRGEDCVEAVRRLSAKGVQAGEIAYLLFCATSQISRIQRNHGIAPAPQPWHWYTDLQTPQVRARAAERRRQNRVARKARV